MKQRIAFASWVIVLALSALAAGQASVILSFEDMDPHIGQSLELRVVDKESQAELNRIVGLPVPDASFELEIFDLEIGRDYRIDLFVDFNENGRYDPPPADHAWRIMMEDVQADEVVNFTHNTSFTDIRWPPQIDGLIEETEYRHILNDARTGMTVYWQNDETVLHIGLVAPGTGWAAIGFDPDSRMRGANIIIGAIQDGVLEIEDHFGSSATAHRSDTDSDIIQAAGSEGDGMTVIEFALFLASSDEQDAVLVPGTSVSILLAYHATSDHLSVRHTARTSAAIELD